MDALQLVGAIRKSVRNGYCSSKSNTSTDPVRTATAALDALRSELEANGVSVKEGSWGYRVLVIDDPDGNQLFFNYPAEVSI